MKKTLRKHKLILDIKSIPHGMTLEKWAYIYRTTNLALWDSALGGIRPQLAGRRIKALKVCDVSKCTPTVLLEK